MKRVEVHVGSLRLTGVPYAERQAFAAGLKEALAHALANADVTASLRNSFATAPCEVCAVRLAHGAATAGVGASAGAIAGTSVSASAGVSVAAVIARRIAR